MDREILRTKLIHVSQQSVSKAEEFTKTKSLERELHEYHSDAKLVSKEEREMVIYCHLSVFPVHVVLIY